ncbi:hypothetical protein ACFL1H_08020, partial [Nanoarchaeota archaeon]
IMLIGSMTFAENMLEIKDKLEQQGHSVNVPCDIEMHVKDNNFIDDLDNDLKHLIENNILKKCFNLIVQSDAILVLNYPKNGIEGYMGTSTLMETGLAYHLSKKIFILKSPPKSKDHRWAHEVYAMEPIIINDDITRITNQQK